VLCNILGGRPIVAELSPVTDFREARCRQYDMGECNRGGFCNFMHLAEPSRALHSTLFDWQRKVLRKKRKQARHKRSQDKREGLDNEHKKQTDENATDEATGGSKELAETDRKRRRTHRERSEEIEGEMKSEVPNQEC